MLALDADTHQFPAAYRVVNKVDFSDFGNLANACIIVATQGEDDDLSVRKSLETTAPYVGFVASSKKALEIRDYLKQEGISDTRISQLKSPVGLDINAKLAGEVAISILAEIIDQFRNPGPSQSLPEEEAEKESEPSPAAMPASGGSFEEEFYINPVCQVPVSKKNPKHVIQYRGETVYFCCDGCKVAFEQNPAQYIK